MPKLKRTPEEQMLFDIRVAIQNKANTKEIAFDSLAKTCGISKRTLYTRMAHPETFRAEELIRLSSRLGGIGITL